MKIELAEIKDLHYLEHADKHISRLMLMEKIAKKEVYLLRDENNILGWFRYGFFWDNTPFLNMLYLQEEYRGKGYGETAMKFWEELMKKEEHKLLLTSTLSNETAQHFYRKLNYNDCGSLILPKEPTEIFFYKII